MRTIFKFPLQLTVEQHLEVHGDFKFLCAQMQNRLITLWAEVDASRPKRRVTVFIVGTGREVPCNAKHYLGTVQDGAYVWHVYVDAELARGA